jgi:hypothetical protein
VLGEFVEPVQLQVACEGLWEALPSGVTEITETHLRARVDQQIGHTTQRAGAHRQIGIVRG